MRAAFDMQTSDVDAAHEICIVVAAGQVTDNDAVAAGGRGVDELTAAHIDASMGAGLAGVAAETALPMA